MVAPIGPESPVEAERRKRTFYLLLMGVASLLVPVLWLLYSRMSDSSGERSTGLSAAELFSKRGTDGSSAVKTTPAGSQAAPAFSAAPAAPAASAAPQNSAPAA